MIARTASIATLVVGALSDLAAVPRLLRTNQHTVNTAQRSWT
jgi:hypothetical protein